MPRKLLFALCERKRPYQALFSCLLIAFILCVSLSVLHELIRNENDLLLASKIWANSDDCEISNYTEESRFDPRAEIRRCPVKTDKTKTLAKADFGDDFENASCGYLVFGRFDDKYARLGNHMFGYAALYGAMARRGKAAGKVAFMQRPVLDKCTALLEDVFEKLSLPVRHYENWWYENKCFMVLNDMRLGTYHRDPLLEDMACDGRNIIMYGYRQSFKYFSHVQEEMRREFTFKAEVRAEASRLISRSLAAGKSESRGDCTLVGAHMRRGDYVHRRAARDMGVIPADEEYLQKAVAYFEQNYSSVTVGKRNATARGSSKLAGCLTFLIFGNDYEWNLNATKTIRLLSSKSQVIVVDHRRSSGPVDLCALSMCDHVIMSAGSYGWWAGFLSRGLVTYHAEFARPGSIIYNFTKRTDYFFPHWIPL